ncbi:SAM-dependent methyltransferase [Bdellovibrio bacteriovorus]|uniref:SAM-dependent methyltransferase n=1 Tax=Bdellovibrio bacteriovorus TaxID=959 RepID=UPI0035A59C94
MIVFDANNPFPLLDLNSYTYQEAQEHSLKVDEHLGFQCESIEAEIRSHAKESSVVQQNWEHLSVQAFQTPYVEIHNILDLLSLHPGDTIVDLGCAYARMALVIQRHFPELQFIGYELENQRVEEAQRILGISSTSIRVQSTDLSAENFHLPSADVYFIFDYGTEANVKKTLQDLQEVAKSRPIQVVGRGRLTRFLIHKEHPWLSEVQEPSHYPHFSIYRS